MKTKKTKYKLKRPNTRYTDPLKRRIQAKKTKYKQKEQNKSLTDQIQGTQTNEN